MTVQANITSQQPVVASIVDDRITAVVSSGSVSAVVSGGVGPQGDQGASGVSAISQASDVSFSTTTDGDVIRYSAGKWRNYQETNLVDGGNF